MNVGYHKADTILRLISSKRPQVSVEIGGYVGYSTILFADAARKAGGSQFVSIEENPKFATVSRALVRLAGLSDFVQIVVGSGYETLRTLHSNGTLRGRADFIFLDHLKPLYAQELQLSERLGLVQVGSLIVADNVIRPGNPAYLQYLHLSRPKVDDTREHSESHAGHGTQYCPNGSPSHVYETETIESFQMSGAQVRMMSRLVVA